MIVATGTGATGWCASIDLDRGGRHLPAPSDPRLAWFVREAWPSPATGAALTEGLLSAGEPLRITAASEQLVIFGDGMEADRLTASWGQEITAQLGARPLRLMQQPVPHPLHVKGPWSHGHRKDQLLVRAGRSGRHRLTSSPATDQEAGRVPRLQCHVKR